MRYGHFIMGAAKKALVLVIVSVFFTLPIFGVMNADARGGGSHSRGSKGGDSHVRGYTKKDGTYVQPHHRSSPNSSRMDNYSTKGNVNPYTGKEGTVDPFRR